MEIRFPYDPNRARNAALWFLHHHGGQMSVLKLVKLLFLADFEHLTRYGRPITGGPYCALEHGPVASSFYEEVKPNANPITEFHRSGKEIVADEAPNEDFLAESDLEALASVNARYGAMDGFRLRDLSHAYRLWTDNWRDDASRKSFAIPFEDFFKDADAPAMLDILRDDNDARAAIG